MRGGRFEKGMDECMRALNASIRFDRRLYREDIAGSQVWAEALAKAGIISAEEAARLSDCLERIEKEIEAGRFVFSEDLEDVHMNVESRLTQLLGDLGAKLHTGRSRNDQVATDLRLYLRKTAGNVAASISDLIISLANVAEREIDVVIPAYTHLQRAQPVLLSHHLLAYAEMFLRDRERFLWARQQADVCPLGAGACAGNQFGIDREFLRERLGFRRSAHNSLDAVSDRDFVCDFLYAAALFQVHLSRFSEDLVLWSSSEFGFITLADEVTSGSSMLPQKRNPDACELARGKSGRAVGHLVGLLVVLKGLPLSYNKDLQEDKEGLFDTIDTLGLLLPVFRKLIQGLRVNRERAESALAGGFLEALSVADYLTRKGVPFRKAHDVVGRLVRRAEELRTTLTQLALEEYRAFDPAFGADLYDAISLEGALRDKDVVGGTAPRRVKEEIERVKRLLGKTKEE